jgi:hypothetical protein
MITTVLSRKNAGTGRIEIDKRERTHVACFIEGKVRVLQLIHVGR